MVFQDQENIPDDFFGKCINVHDGDTCKVEMSSLKSLLIDIRFAFINAPELKKDKGKESRDWLRKKILNKEVFVTHERGNKFGKWGRFIGIITQNGEDINQSSMLLGHSKAFGDKDPFGDLEREIKDAFKQSI